MVWSARKVLAGVAVLAALSLLGAYVYLQHPKFGASPEGERLEKIQRSSHYAEGEFHNPVPTPVLSDGVSTFSILLSSLLNPGENLQPPHPVPVVKTDLKGLDRNRDTIIWLGHSSFFVVASGKRILIDPVFSPFAAPVSFSTRAFEGTSLYTADDMPEIDLLLITHDHWDHLDYATVTALHDKVGQVMVPLGGGAHLERWGYTKATVNEADWYDRLDMDGGLAVHLVPARHYSGRWLTRNKSLWGGFVLEAGGRRILFSGDTGYGPHFKELAERFGEFDWAALDMGQYDPRWPFIHMTPEEAVQAAEDLRIKTLMPAHVGRFSIACHAWDEPFERITAASRGKTFRLLTPKIGEPFYLDDRERIFPSWWK